MLAWSTRALRRFEREDLFAGRRLGCFMFLGYAFQTAGLQYTTPSESGFVTGSSVGSKKQKLKIEIALMAVGVVLHVDLVEHGGGGGVRFFVGVDCRDVLQAC